MQKKFVFSLIAVLFATSANAGLMDFFGLGNKESEPQTLADACNKDEIKKFCPEILLGEKTIPECLIDNVKSLSKKCANFVKKQATNAVNNAVPVNSVQEQTDKVVVQKTAAETTAKNVKTTAKQVESSVKETSNIIKNML